MKLDKNQEIILGQTSHISWNFVRCSKNNKCVLCLCIGFCVGLIQLAVVCKTSYMPVSLSELDFSLENETSSSCARLRKSLTNVINTYILLIRFVSVPLCGVVIARECQRQDEEHEVSFSSLFSTPLSCKVKGGNS